MTREQLQAIRRHFHEYADGYIARAGDMRHMMELKRTHCAFVARNCCELAVSSGWNPSDLRAAEALGFLHDVGRFPQLEEYGTFRDDRSIDHGERGWRAIRESGLLDGIDPGLRAALLDGVRYHNARALPENLPPEHYRWLRLIRDADRLDIYRVVLDTFDNDRVEEHPDIVLNLSIDGAPSARVLETIRRREQPAYPDLRTVSDFILMLLSWSYQMNFPAARATMLERGIFDRLAGHLPARNPETDALLSDLRKELVAGH